MITRLGSIALCALAACSDASGSKIEVRPAKVVPTTTPMAMEPAQAAGSDAPAVDDKKGDKQDAEWVPAEFKTGTAKFKDCGVYVDGEIRGFLRFGELPLALKPTWYREKMTANKRPGTNDPGWRWGQTRFYKFTDYLKAIGLDLRTIKEIHVSGSRQTQTIVATGKDLLSPGAKEFWFRFGGSYTGKPIPHVPPNFGNQKAPDLITNVSVYIAKKPPTLDPHQGLVLDGVKQVGVPYHGDPIRGGIHVYLDDKLAAIIKRQELDPKRATKSSTGELQWKLSEVLAGLGVDLKKVVELWVVRDEFRKETIPASELATLTFEASPFAKGGVVLGAQHVRADVLALHTRHVAPGELPIVTSDEEEE